MNLQTIKIDVLFKNIVKYIGNIISFWLNNKI